MLLIITCINLCNICSTKETFEIIQSIVIILSILVGGGWTLYKFVIQRAFETALDINVDIKYKLLNESNYLVCVNTQLRNIGQRKITAKSNREKDNNEFVYKDEKDSVRHSYELQIKKIKNNFSITNQHISWYNGSYFEDNIISVNMIEEYEITKNDCADFFMEPNEVYKFPQPIVLSNGHYIGKLIFIGDRSEKEYWSQMFYFEINNLLEDDNGKAS